MPPSPKPNKAEYPSASCKICGDEKERGRRHDKRNCRHDETHGDLLDNPAPDDAADSEEGRVEADAESRSYCAETLVLKERRAVSIRARLHKK